MKLDCLTKQLLGTLCIFLDTSNCHSSLKSVPFGTTTDPLNFAPPTCPQNLMPARIWWTNGLCSCTNPNQTIFFPYKKLTQNCYIIRTKEKPNKVEKPHYVTACKMPGALLRTGNTAQNKLKGVSAIISRKDQEILLHVPTSWCSFHSVSSSHSLSLPPFPCLGFRHQRRRSGGAQHWTDVACGGPRRREAPLCWLCSDLGRDLNGDSELRGRRP